MGDIIMTTRENLLSLVRRQGYESVPVHFGLCPHLAERYKNEICNDKTYPEYYNFPYLMVGDLKLKEADKSLFIGYYDFELKNETIIDQWGVAHEPGSANAMHMSRMRHPLATIDSLEQLQSYPFPDYLNAEDSHQITEANWIIGNDKIAVGHMQCSIWETSWYIRSMEELMMDMIGDDPKAEYLLDKITNLAVKRAQSFATAGVDVLYLGDDIGMQKNIMMSVELYCDWLKPRLKRVIDAARAIKPDILIYYHSCGYVIPFLPHLIEVGVDVFNPVQPECMSFEELHKEFGDKLSFSGTIGTQTTMPFGTPEDVRAEVFRNLKIAGTKGGLLVEPTHILEPEVPWENIEAYVKACLEF
jgi:uroporphyrinogen decarboxylase